VKLSMSINKSSYRVYYEDTDSGGVVYYANYLKFAERARTDLLRSKGIIQSELVENNDTLFVVKHVDMDLKKPARLDDLIEVSTEIMKISGASMVMRQILRCNDIELVAVDVTIVCVNSDLKPKRLSKELREFFV